MPDHGHIRQDRKSVPHLTTADNSRLTPEQADTRPAICLVQPPAEIHNLCNISLPAPKQDIFPPHQSCNASTHHVSWFPSKPHCGNARFRYASWCKWSKMQEQLPEERACAASKGWFKRDLSLVPDWNHRDEGLVTLAIEIQAPF